MKKIISALLCVLMIFSTFSIFESSNLITANAADYAETLKSKGFPEGYIDSLVALHKKYPNWIFKPLKTGLKWATAVKGERASHSQQLIQNTSYYNETMFCKCSLCYKNGKYVVQEQSNWVSASQHAVEYYMDPRNWLTEKEIFQFESTAYDGTQTKSGVEAILDGTWMEDSLITYKNASGATKTYSSTVKYSDAIMSAANDSGMSAYYLASKIRQEVGGAKNTAGGASGTNSTYPGIYNYYNIGAYTGALDGLKWAAQEGTPEGYYTNTTCNVRESATTSSPIVVCVASGTAVTVKKTTSVQADNYKWYKVELKYGGKTCNGYIRSDLVTKKNATSASYGRPWTNPYKSIYNGAQFISDNYGTQTSGYLQKFNVNPASKYPFTHEYMANVAAAVSESRTTYEAYSKAGILSVTKTFEIPVFNNMPNETEPEISVDKVANLKATDNDSTSITIQWDKVSGASGYSVQVYRSGAWKTFATTTKTKMTVDTLYQLSTYRFRVRAYVTNAGKKIYGSYSDKIAYSTRGTIKNLKGVSTNTTVTLSWKKISNATGYKIYKYNGSKKSYELFKEVKASNNSMKISGLKKNTSYKYRVVGIRDIKDKTYKTYNANITVKTKNNEVTISSAKSNATQRITVKWKKLSESCSGYQVRWSTTSDFSSNFLTVTKSGRSTVSTTLKTAQSNRIYYVKVRAYKTVNGKKTYYSWSDTLKVKVK